MLIFILWALYREQRWIITQLYEEVATGMVTPVQYKIASSAWNQTRSRLKAFQSGHYRQTNRFYLLSAELAFKKHQASALGENPQHQSEIERLRSELNLLSPQITS